MKICIIGPTYPFRGGIAHYTTLLFRYFRKTHQTMFVAFKRQYPQWLFPGETDRDPSKKPMIEAGVVHLLDSMSPLSWMKVVRKIRLMQPRLVIIPWWTAFWTIPFFCIISLTKAGTDAKILFICHNVRAHESSILSRMCTRLILRMGDLHLVHSREEYQYLSRMIRRSIVIQGFHPTYGNLSDGKLNERLSHPEDARRKLNAAGKVLLFFGFVRPYKGLVHLLDALPSIIDRLGSDLTLMVVGECWEDEAFYEKRIQDLGIERHILRINQYVPNEQVGLYFSAADLAVIPYESATGSGILQMAFGCNTPVVATSVGGLADDVTDGETGYLVPPSDPDALASAIVRYFIEDKSRLFADNIMKTKDRFSWDRLIDLIVAGMEQTA